MKTEHRPFLIPVNKGTISRLVSTKFSDLHDTRYDTIYPCLDLGFIVSAYWSKNKKKTTKSFQALFQCINPLNPKIKIKIFIWFVTPINLL